MQIPLRKIQWVEFREHPIALFKDGKVGFFEIYSNGLEGLYNRQNFNHQLYCKLLIEKVLDMEPEMLSHFLVYQCKLLSNASAWLIALKVLLKNNAEMIIDLGFASKLNKAFSAVNDKRTEYQKNPLLHSENDNPYRFDLIKLHLDTLKTHHEKKEYLFRMKTNYLQNRYDYDRADRVDFDEKIDLELAYLDYIAKMRKKKDFSLEAKPLVLKWEGQINILADFYYQCLNHKTEKNRPILKSTKRDIENFIVKYYRKPDGSEFNATTIRTILTPSRNEKRPNADKRISLEKIIEKYEGLNFKS